MIRELNGLTAYTKDEKDCFGLVVVRSNMGDLSVYSSIPDQQIYEAEISFPGNNCLSLLPANPLRLTLRTDDVRAGQSYETWKITGQVEAFTVNFLKISLSLVEHYIDGDEHIYWDAYKYIHRIDGKDYMEETRKNVGIG